MIVEADVNASGDDRGRSRRVVRVAQRKTRLLADDCQSAFQTAKRVCVASGPTRRVPLDARPNSPSLAVAIDPCEIGQQTKRLQLHVVVFGAGGLGNEGAWRRKVEAYGIVEGKRNLVLRPYACSQRHAPDDPTHGVDFVTGTEFEGQT